METYASVAREAADEWAEVALAHPSARARTEASLREGSWTALAELADTVVACEELWQFEDRNTLAVRLEGGR